MRILLSTIVLLAIMVSPTYVFAKKDKGLPPGLQKKQMQGKALPPGWQKKLAKGNTLDIHVYRAGTIIVPPDPLGILTINIEDRILKVHKDTLKIIKILK